MAEASSKTPVKVDNSKDEPVPVTVDDSKNGSKPSKRDDSKKGGSKQEADRSVDSNGNPVVSFAELDEFHEQIPGIAAPESKK